MHFYVAYFKTFRQYFNAYNANSVYFQINHGIILRCIFNVFFSKIEACLILLLNGHNINGGD